MATVPFRSSCLSQDRLHSVRALLGASQQFWDFGEPTSAVGNHEAYKTLTLALRILLHWERVGHDPRDMCIMGRLLPLAKRLGATGVMSPEEVETIVEIADRPNPWNAKGAFETLLDITRSHLLKADEWVRRFDAIREGDNLKRRREARRCAS